MVYYSGANDSPRRSFVRQQVPDPTPPTMKTGHPGVRRGLAHRALLSGASNTLGTASSCPEAAVK